MRNATGRGVGGTLVALAALAVSAFVAHPAHADEPADLRVEVQTGGVTLKSGGQPGTLSFTVVNDGPSSVSAPIVNVQVPFGDRGVRVVSSNPACQAVSGPNVLACPLSGLEPGQSAGVTIVIAPPPAGSVSAGETLSQPGAVSVYNPAGGDPNTGNDSGQFGVEVVAGAGAVTQVSGTVADSFTGQGVPGAAVLVTDSAGATCRTTTKPDGAYVCAATAAAPLAAGKITIKVTRDGYQPATEEADAQGPLNGVQIGLDPLTTVSATPSASGPAVLDKQSDIVASDSGSGLTVLIVVLGSLLVLAALGGAGWWLYRSHQADSRPDRPDRPDPEPRPFMDAPTQRIDLRGAAYSGAGATQVIGGYGDAQPTTMFGRDSYGDAQPTTALGVPRGPSRYEDGAAYDLGAGYGAPTGYGGADDTARSTAAPPGTTTGTKPDTTGPTTAMATGPPRPARATRTDWTGCAASGRPATGRAPARPTPSRVPAGATHRAGTGMRSTARRPLPAIAPRSTAIRSLRPGPETRRSTRTPARTVARAWTRPRYGTTRPRPGRRTRSPDHATAATRTTRTTTRRTAEPTSRSPVRPTGSGAAGR